MDKIKRLFKQVNFYIACAAFVFTLIAIILYAVNCPSEFNGENVSSAVIAGDTLAIVFLVISLGGMVVNLLFDGNGIISQILKYTRFGLYAAFICLLVAFFMQILDEYSLLGTILYPIVSGTVGDPVDPVLSSSYFTSLIFTLVSCVLAIVAALLKKGQAYREELITEEVK